MEELSEDNLEEISGGVGVSFDEMGGSITVQHKGGYVAQFFVRYTSGGTPTQMRSDFFTAGMSRSIKLPGDATNIYIEIKGATGLIWDAWNTIMEKGYDKAQNIKIVLLGTSLRQKYEETVQ